MEKLKGGHWEQFEGAAGTAADDIHMDELEGRDKHDMEEEEWEQEVADTLASLSTIHVEEG